MRRRVVGLILLVALMVVVMAAPVAAAGCQLNGLELAQIGHYGQGEPVMSAGEVWSGIAVAQHHDDLGDEGDGPGVLARYLHLHMEVHCEG